MFSTRCRNLQAVCEFGVVCFSRVVIVLVPSTTESMPLNRHICASMQLALRETLMLCSLPKQRHMLGFCSLQQSRSFFPLLSGIVLDFLGPRDVCEPLSEACHGELHLPTVADWSSNSSFSFSDSLICDRQLSRCSFFRELHTCK